MLLGDTVFSCIASSNEDPSPTDDYLQPRSREGSARS